MSSNEAQNKNEHAKTVSSMFASIVPYYDLLNTILSAGQDRRWRKRLAYEASLKSTGIILDLASGTLKVSLALRKKYPQAQILSMDFCHSMLLKGAKSLDKNTKIIPIEADATCIPLPDNSVDSITMAFGIRNILPRDLAFKEMERVLVPGGRVCILEFGSSKKKILKGLYNFYLNNLLPLLGKIISKDAYAYTYLAETINKFPMAKDLEKEMCSAGFNCAWHIPLTFGIVCIHVAEKRKLIAPDQENYK